MFSAAVRVFHYKYGRNKNAATTFAVLWKKPFYSCLHCLVWRLQDLQEAVDSSLPAWVSKMKWSGDLRVRYENIEGANRNSVDFSTADKNTYKIRARYGFITQINDQVEMGIRVATGKNNSILTQEQEISILGSLNKLNMYFTENSGQVGTDSVKYYIQGKGVWFLDNSVVFEIREPIKKSKSYREPFDNYHPKFENEKPQPRKSIALKLNFEGCNEVEPKGIGILPYRSNYFYGNDSSNWCTNVPNYQEIIYENIYNNIDLRYYSNENRLKYDFIVHPTGNAEDIRLKFEGINDLIINELDNLVIKTDLGDIEDSDIFIYQNCYPSQERIEGKFKLYNSMEYGFEIIDDYDTNKILVIDPLINYSTFIGGASHENSRDIAIDTAGNGQVRSSCYAYGCLRCNDSRSVRLSYTELRPEYSEKKISYNNNQGSG